MSATTDRRRRHRTSSDDHDRRSRPTEQHRQTSVPAGASSPLIFEHPPPERPNVRVTSRPIVPDAPPPLESRAHAQFAGPGATSSHAPTAAIHVRPPIPPDLIQEFDDRQPEYTRTPQPPTIYVRPPRSPSPQLTPTAFVPAPPRREPSPEWYTRPTTRPPAPIPPAPEYIRPPTRPPVPEPEPVTIVRPAMPVPAPILPHQPRGILRRDSEPRRHRRPSGSGPIPVVRVESPTPTYEGRGASPHRLPPWTLPGPEPPAGGWYDAQGWSGDRPYDREPSWKSWRPSEEPRGSSSGRPRKGSQGSGPRPPEGIRSPPFVRSPPAERQRQSSSFVSNDPFKIQTPLRRRRYVESMEDEVPLNFDSIPLPGEERTSTDESSAEGETVVSPLEDGEGKIGSQVTSDHGSQQSGAGSKSSMLSSTPIAQITDYVIPVVPFIFTTLLGQAYVLVMLRLPLLYFTRVARIFEEADLSVGDLKHMALEAGLKSRGKTSSRYELEFQVQETPRYQTLKTTWGGFIDSVMQEWTTFNVISVLLLP